MDQQFSLQTEFKPPTDPISDSEFVPPTKSIDDKELGPISRFFNAINTPLVNITPEMQRAMQSYQEQHPILGTIGNFGTGMMTAASSPLGLGLGALTGGANLAEQAGMTTTARLLHTPGQIGALGMGAHGLYNFANQPTLAGKTEGLLEAGLGGLGAYGLQGNIDKVAPIESLKYENPNLEWRPPIKITKEPLGLKSAPFISGEQGTTQGNQNFNLGIGINNNVPPEIAAQYGIQAGKTRLPNEFSAVGNEQTGRPQFADPNKKAFDIARDKFNMGRELPADQVKDVFSDIDFDETNGPTLRKLATDETGAITFNPDAIRKWFKDNLDKFKNNEEFQAGLRAIKQGNWARASRVMKDNLNSKEKQQFKELLANSETKPKLEEMKEGNEKIDTDEYIEQLEKQNKKPLDIINDESGAIGDGPRKPDPRKKDPIPQEIDSEKEQAKQIAITKLTDALKNAGTLRTEQESLYSEERAKRIARAQSVTKIDSNTGQIRNPGLRGFYQQLGHLRGELPKVDFSRTPLSQKDVNTLIDTITNSKVLLPWEEIRAKIGLLKLISAKREELPQRNELALLGKVFGPQFDQIIQMHGGLGGPMAKKALVEIIGSSKAIMASIDLSAPLRQGLPLIHRREWWNAIGPMIKSFGDKDYFDALQKSLEERPNYLLGKAAGLKLTEISDNPSLREEQYSSTLASKIPLVKHSERAYVGFLNKLRADTFDSLIENAEDLNLSTFTRTSTNDMIPTKLGNEIARFVNNATGRGSLDFSKVPGGKGNFEKIAPELNSIFFSPRLIASRLTILNPNYYIKASPFVRKEAIKSLLAIAGFGLTTNSLLAAMGGKTNTQLSDNKGTFPSIPGLPTNADFMKSKFGNTRIDPYGGFQPYIVATGRLLSGETTSSNTGKTTALGKGYASHTHKDVVEDFVANKLSPIASLLYVLSKDKDFEGNSIDVKKEIMSRFIPMFLQDLHDIYVDDPSHLPLGLGAVFGMGTQTYKASQKPAFNLRLR